MLTENDYKVGITGRNTELLNELKEIKPDFFLIKTFDATETSTTIERLEELATELGGLDILIMSSGIGDLNETLDFEIERKVIDLNVTSLCCS